MSASDFFKRVKANLTNLENDILNEVVAVEAENFHAENFRKQGFTDTAFEPWQRRKEDLAGDTYDSLLNASRGIRTVKVKRGEKPKPKQRALLVLSSTLKGHALKGRVQGNNVVFSFPLEYMKVHNEGLKAGRGDGFKMPKRQFVGESEYLKNRIQKKAERLADQFLRNLNR